MARLLPFLQNASFLPVEGLRRTIPPLPKARRRLVPCGHAPVGAWPRGTSRVGARLRSALYSGWIKRWRGCCFSRKTLVSYPPRTRAAGLHRRGAKPAGLACRLGCCLPVADVQHRPEWQRRPVLNGTHWAPAPQSANCPAGSPAVGKKAACPAGPPAANVRCRPTQPERKRAAPSANRPARPRAGHGLSLLSGGSRRRSPSPGMGGTPAAGPPLRRSSSSRGSWRRGPGPPARLGGRSFPGPPHAL